MNDLKAILVVALLLLCITATTTATTSFALAESGFCDGYYSVRQKRAINPNSWPNLLNQHFTLRLYNGTEFSSHFNISLCWPNETYTLRDDGNNKHHHSEEEACIVGKCPGFNNNRSIFEDKDSLVYSIAESQRWVPDQPGSPSPVFHLDYISVNSQTRLKVHVICDHSAPADNAVAPLRGHDVIFQEDGTEKNVFSMELGTRGLCQPPPSPPPTTLSPPTSPPPKTVAPTPPPHPTSSPSLHNFCNSFFINGQQIKPSAWLPHLLDADLASPKQAPFHDEKTYLFLNLCFPKVENPDDLHQTGFVSLAPAARRHQHPLRRRHRQIKTESEKKSLSSSFFRGVTFDEFKGMRIRPSDNSVIFTYSSSYNNSIVTGRSGRELLLEVTVSCPKSKQKQIIIKELVPSLPAEFVVVENHSAFQMTLGLSLEIDAMCPPVPTLPPPEHQCHDFSFGNTTVRPQQWHTLNGIVTDLEHGFKYNMTISLCSKKMFDEKGTKKQEQAYIFMSGGNTSSSCLIFEKQEVILWPDTHQARFEFVGGVEGEDRISVVVECGSSKGLAFLSKYVLVQSVAGGKGKSVVVELTHPVLCQIP